MAGLNEIDTTEEQFDAMLAVASPVKLAMTNPFADQEALGCDVAKAIDPSQLTDEIKAATGVDVQVCISNPNPEQPIGLDNPGRLYLTPPIDVDQARRLINDHQVDSRYGMDLVDVPIERIQQKLSDGGTLSPEEISDALRVLLRGGS